MALTMMPMFLADASLSSEHHIFAAMLFLLLCHLRWPNPQQSFDDKPLAQPLPGRTHRAHAHTPTTEASLMGLLAGRQFQATPRNQATPVDTKGAQKSRYPRNALVQAGAEHGKHIMGRSPPTGLPEKKANKNSHSPTQQLDPDTAAAR